MGSCFRVGTTHYGKVLGGGGGIGRERVHETLWIALQEASRNADELLKAEEKEKREAEKRKQKNKKVSISVNACINHIQIHIKLIVFTITSTELMFSCDKLFTIVFKTTEKRC